MAQRKRALITGTTGQDGSYLSELLLSKGYEVYGTQRRTSVPNTARIEHLKAGKKTGRFFTVHADLSDSSNLFRVISKIKPNEIYNLGAQSHVGISFDIPEYTVNVNALGPLRILEVIRSVDFPIRYYQASSSEMFGKVLETPQKETTPFNPQSPYGASKVFAFNITKIYRDGYGLFASNGVLFNHESPRRGLNFVTRKITLSLARIKLGLQPILRLGNLDAKRDWGHSKDYVEAIWKILQHETPDDFVIATGETHTVREFVNEVAKHLGFELVWKGSGLKEHAVDKKTRKTIVVVDERYFKPTEFTAASTDGKRPNEVGALLGDSSKARRILGWKPRYTFKKLAELMATEDLKVAEQEARMHTPIVYQRKIMGYGQNGKNIRRKKARRNKN